MNDNETCSFFKGNQRKEFYPHVEHQQQKCIRPKKMNKKKKANDFEIQSRKEVKDKMIQYLSQIQAVKTEFKKANGK